MLAVLHVNLILPNGVLPDGMPLCDRGQILYAGAGTAIPTPMFSMPMGFSPAPASSTKTPPACSASSSASGGWFPARMPISCLRTRILT